MSNTPLMQAIASENLELVQVLLESGIKTGINDFYDAAEITPLILAIEKQNIDLIKILLENGAKDGINKPVKVLDTTITPAVCVIKSPLKCAIDSGNLEIVKILIENGATDAAASSSKAKEEK